MSLLIIVRGIACACVAVSLVACGQADEAAEARRRSAEAGSQAERALDATARLESRLDKALSKVDELGRDRRDLQAASSALETRLARLAQRLGAAVGDLRAGSAEASQAASSAAATASGIARELAVLTKRFDYHLAQGGD